MILTYMYVLLYHVDTMTKEKYYISLIDESSEPLLLSATDKYYIPNVSNNKFTEYIDVH
jgi:hypothetical protein